MQIRVSALAQCSAATVQSITYDTVVSGTGNNIHLLSLPQFDPALGTLFSASIRSVVTVNYGFTLQNQDPINNNITVSVSRNDHIQSTALSTAYDNTIDTAIGTFALPPGGVVARTPYTVIYRYDNADSISSDLVNFLGTSKVNFNYKPLTYGNLAGVSTYSYGATANDTIRFSITYTYCGQELLASRLKDFSAQRGSLSDVVLSWITLNEQSGRIYQIEVGTDADHFNTAGTLPSADQAQTRQYDFNYQVGANEHEKLYFRLKTTDASGTVSYSEVKMVDMRDTGRGMYLYPNPSDQFVNVVFNQVAQAWKLDIFASNGVLLQSIRTPQVNQYQVYFAYKLPSGAYFMRVQAEGSGESHLLRFVVH